MKKAKVLTWIFQTHFSTKVSTCNVFMYSIFSVKPKVLFDIDVKLESIFTLNIMYIVQYCD